MDLVDVDPGDHRSDRDSSPWCWSFSPDAEVGIDRRERHQAPDPGVSHEPADTDSALTKKPVVTRRGGHRPGPDVL